MLFLFSYVFDHAQHRSLLCVIYLQGDFFNWAPPEVLVGNLW